MPKKSVAISRLLIVLSACLFLATVAKAAVSIKNSYGSSLFTTLDDISDAMFLPWLATLTIYILSQERSHSGR